MVTILGKEIPNRIEELTIEQFEAITDINNNKEIDPVDRHLQIFDYLGIPESEFFDFDINDFIDIVKEFNTMPEPMGDIEPIGTLELDGFTYTAELKLTVRETKLIEKIAIHKQKGYISDMMAVMFKADHLTPAEHYADAHLKLKSKHIRKLKAEICIPYIMFVANKIKKQVENVPTETIEDVPTQ
jgi:hypothetical protein